jgi:two-component system response regulator AtoC
MREMARRMRLAAPRLSARAELALAAYHYPGNVRELRNIVERAVVVSGGEIDVEHLGLARAEGASAEHGSHAIREGSRPRLRDTTAACERARIVDALQETGGNQVAAAKLLGVSRRSLINKIERYAIARPRKRGCGDASAGVTEYGAADPRPA